MAMQRFGDYDPNPQYMLTAAFADYLVVHDADFFHDGLQPGLMLPCASCRLAVSCMLCACRAGLMGDAPAPNRSGTGGRGAWNASSPFHACAGSSVPSCVLPCPALLVMIWIDTFCRVSSIHWRSASSRAACPWNGMSWLLPGYRIWVSDRLLPPASAGAEV